MVFYADNGGYILRAAKNADLYIRWSSMCDGTDPEFIGTKEEFLAAYSPERVALAEEHGSSDQYMVEEHGRFGGWDDTGFVVNHRTPQLEPGEEKFFWLPRENLLEYATRLSSRDHEGAQALLEKRDCA